MLPLFRQSMILCINFFVLHPRHVCCPILKMLMAFDKGSIKGQKKYDVIPALMQGTGLKFLLVNVLSNMT